MKTFYSLYCRTSSCQGLKAPVYPACGQASCGRRILSIKTCIRGTPFRQGLSSPGKILLAALVACGCGCSGPHPTIVKQELKLPTSHDAPYTLVVTVRNESGGEGQAELTARLHPRGSDTQTVAQVTQDVDLSPHETVAVTLSLPTTERGDYTADVEMHYPPQ